MMLILDAQIIDWRETLFVCEEHDHVPCQLMKMSLSVGFLRVGRPESDSHQGHE